MHLAKVPSTPADQSEGVLHGIDEVCRIAGRAPADVATVLHGTTVATNTVLTGTGARVGLLVTQGFRYLLHLARSWTPGPLFGWMIYEKPDPIAAVEDTLEVPERMDARGRVLTPLDRDALVAAATRLRDAGVDVLTVCFLNSFANPAHEREAAAAPARGAARPAGLHLLGRAARVPRVRARDDDGHERLRAAPHARAT